MPEALARVRNDSILSGLAKSPAFRGGIASALARRAKALPVGAYVGAALLAVVFGIGVNALVLQRGRHPAPLFAPAAPLIPPALSRPRSTPSFQSAVAAGGASTPVPVPLPPSERPPAAGDASSAQRAPDPIADLLRGEPHTEEGRLILSAQNALARLGYAVKTDGNEGRATEEALLAFERAHGLPLTKEISPQLVRQLASAARKATR